MVFLRPASLGGPAGYVIVSGSSMEPLMETGDLAIVRQEADYGLGDVVAYRIPASDVGGGMLVIHRVVGGDPDDGLILRGDNRDTDDMWRPTRDDIVGRLLWHVPHAGTALFLLRTPLVIAGVVGFLGFWAVVSSPAGRSKDAATDEEADDGMPVAAEHRPAPTPPAARPVQGNPYRTADAAAAAVVLI